MKSARVNSLRPTARDAEERRVKKLRTQDGGKDGSRLSTVRLRLSDERMGRQVMRSRPGTFEWRYGRNRQDALFHAGSHFAQLWERAGATVASSADFLRGIRSSYITGIADGRLTAIDKLRGCVEALGRFGFERLMAYCVEGKTAAEIAKMEGQDERQIATVLHHDLRHCAIHFNFLGSARKKVRNGSETS